MHYRKQGIIGKKKETFLKQNKNFYAQDTIYMRSNRRVYLDPEE